MFQHGKWATFNIQNERSGNWSKVSGICVQTKPASAFCQMSEWMCRVADYVLLHPTDDKWIVYPVPAQCLRYEFQYVDRQSIDMTLDVEGRDATIKWWLETYPVTTGPEFDPDCAIEHYSQDMRDFIAQEAVVS